MVGLKTDTTSGEYVLDEEAFKKALETNLDEVIRLFLPLVSLRTPVSYWSRTMILPAASM